MVIIRMARINGLLIYALAVNFLVANFAAAEELTLNINLKKPIAVVSEKFLSITLDPLALFNTDFFSDAEKSTNMARALSPAYVRIGGPRSNSYVFERGLYPQETHHDPGLTVTETHWINLHQWAERSGLEIVACIAPQMSEAARAWDPRNALDLISFSDHMGYNTSWQLGYECQTNCKISGGDLGRDVARLRNMLDAFPQFAKTGLVTGPDVVAWETKQEQQYLQDYFNAAAAGLDAMTWHPDFASVSLEDDGVSMHYDTLAVDRDALYKVIGRQIAKKPLWIAESKPENCKRQFLGALVWARRLGNSAKVGAQVLMRQPENSNFLKPTPDFWVSMLHKKLVGREVLDIKIATGNRTHVQFYAQCTRPSSQYEKGSVTVFGINLTPNKIAATLKGLKMKTVHKYVLLPGYDATNRMFAETVLLNNDLLSLINGREMPEINPVVYNVEKDIKLKLPSGGIGFWVLPGLKIKSCMGPDDDISDKNILRKTNKRLEDLGVAEDLEPGDNDGREKTDVSDSYADRKSLLRHKLLKRLPSGRSIRQRGMDRDDEKISRRGDAIKRDVRRHEQFARKKEDSVESEDGVYVTSDEKDENENFEEAIEQKILDSGSLDSGEEIRAKLLEYKRRLADHEYRKKQREKVAALTKELDSTPNQNMDTEKVIEALTLITEVESAMKDLDKSNHPQQRLSTPPTFDASDASDITAALNKDSNGDLLLDEVLNTEKAKRTAIPTKIEDQLKALYRLLSEEKDKKDDQIAMRSRRDLDKRLGDDPLGIRRDSIFLRKRTGAKERRNERRQRIREKLEEHRRGRENIKKVPRDTSSENNFYGFQYRAPIKNFPEGDIYLQGTIPAVGQENAKVKKITRAVDEHDNVWLEEGDGNHMPNEFYENVKLQAYNPMVNLKQYGELWEAESVHKVEGNEKNVNGAAEYATTKIVTEKPLTEAEDRKAKEQAVQQLINYYETVPQEQIHDFEELRQQGLQAQQQQQSAQAQPIQQVYYQPLNYQQTVTAGNSGQYYAGSQVPLSDANRYYVDPSQYLQQNRRAKRDLNDIEDLLRQEMIDEDDNNLRDCQCRVIRGIDNCRDCQMQAARQLESSYVMPSQMIKYPAVPSSGQGVRTRRDTTEVSPADEAETATTEVIAVIPEGAPNIPESIAKIPEVEPEDAVETREEEIDEALAPAAIDEDTEAPIEDSTVNIELTMESSKQAEPEIIALEPVEHTMNLEGDGDEPLTSRVARRTNSTAKFFRSKKRASRTTTEANPAETTGAAEGHTTNVEPAIDKQNKTADERDEIASSVDQGTVEATENRFPASTINAAANQPPTAGFVKAPNQTPSTVFARPTHESPATTGPIAAQSQSFGTNAKAISDSVTKSKRRHSAKASDTIAIEAAKLDAKTFASTPGSGDQANAKITIPIPNGQIKPNAKTSASSGKTQSEDNDTQQTSRDQAASPILGKATTKKDVTKSTNQSQPKKPSTTTKSEQLAKARHARLTTRSEALAALRKENENRRAKKMIEASMKLLESESARFTEYEKRRREQLDRLKSKLRAKRERMLHQYREELIEAINDSEDQKTRNLQRRNLFDGYPKTDGTLGFETYAPIGSVRPLHDDSNLRRAARSRSEGQYFTGHTSSEEYEASKNVKRSMSLDQSFDDKEEIYDTSDSEFRPTNFKRSPMVVFDYSKHGEAQAMEGDSGEYYTPEEQRQLEQRVLAAQQRLQQQHKQKQLQAQKQRERKKGLEQALLQKQATSQQQQLQQQQQQQQYPQVQPAYAAQFQPSYPTQQQSPATYPSQYATGYYPQSQRNVADKNAMHLNVHYNQVPQQQQAVHPTQATSAPQPEIPQRDPKIVSAQPSQQLSSTSAPQPQADLELYTPKSGASNQQQSIVQAQTTTNLERDAPQSVAAQQQQQSYAQQPNAALYYKGYSVPSGNPAVDDYNQEPTSSYYSYAQANVQPQQSKVEYADQQASVLPQQPQMASVLQQQPLPQQPQTANNYYGFSPAEQQYYFPSAPTEQQTPDADYYRQAFAAAQQQPDASSNSQNPDSTPQTSADVYQRVILQSSPSNLQPAPSYNTPRGQVGGSHQAVVRTIATGQNRQTPTAQQIANANLYEELSENTENLQELKVYQPDPTEKPPVVPYNNYYQYYRDLSQQEANVNEYKISPTAYETIHQVAAPRGYKEAKRSNVKLLEINPSIYDDDDSDHNLHELFMKPSSRFSSRNYRSYSTDGKRYRRDVTLDDKEGGPLSISLGLKLSDMMPKKNNPEKSDASNRRKRQTQEVDFPKSRSTIKKNIKKVYRENNYKKSPKKLTTLKRIDETESIPKVRKLRNIDDSINYFTPVEVFANNELEQNTNVDTISTRRRRSPEARNEMEVTYNHINRNEDSEMNEIWNDIIEMKQDEALDEYDRRKDELFASFMQDHKPDVLLINDKEDSMIQKVSESTTKANIESMIEEAIPKLETVITGGIEKAQNLTGNLEDFIENFDEQFDETTEYVQETSAGPQATNNGRLSHSVFKTMIGGVKKFFGFLSGVSKIFHKH